MDSAQHIVIATHNKHKLSEITPFFSATTWTPVTADELDILVPEVEETGKTFSENAELKARAFLEACNKPVVADDSGLEVTALNDEPGVHSNRWFSGNYQARNEALLDRLKGETNRTARFVTVTCLLFPAEQPQFFRGEVNGTIALEPRGLEGFGYDPLFIPDGYTQSFAELGDEIKSRLSHRARAFNQVVTALKDLSNAK
ncbi:RdgB/HAM1 family non-canonical purine NTP pyrophosphatase [Candidatus Woesebacteria bacterium]|nr:RdgB/HAM1 family non-canonical purine NTP pyrophosphatase [Candidatus Woesebacteria bacterium]